MPFANGNCQKMLYFLGNTVGNAEMQLGEKTATKKAVVLPIFFKKLSQTPRGLQVCYLTSFKILLEIHACSNPSPLRACNYIFGIR